MALTRRCLNILSSSENFISAAFHESPSHVVCQFANLLLFYSICGQIARGSNLYTIKEEELEEGLESWVQFLKTFDTESIDVSNTIEKSVASFRKQKKRVRSEAKESGCAKDEYDFIKEMLLSVSYKQRKWMSHSVSPLPLANRLCPPIHERSPHSLRSQCRPRRSGTPAPKNRSPYPSSSQSSLTSALFLAPVSPQEKTSPDSAPRS